MAALWQVTFFWLVGFVWHHHYCTCVFTCVAYRLGAWLLLVLNFSLNVSWTTVVISVSANEESPDRYVLPQVTCLSLSCPWSVCRSPVCCQSVSHLCLFPILDMAVSHLSVLCMYSIWSMCLSPVTHLSITFLCITYKSSPCPWANCFSFIYHIWLSLLSYVCFFPFICPLTDVCSGLGSQGQGGPDISSHSTSFLP